MKRKLTRIALCKLILESLNPGDGKLNDSEAVMLKQLAADAADEESQEPDGYEGDVIVSSKLDIQIFKGIEDFISKFDRWAVNWQNYIRAPWHHHKRTHMIKSHYDSLKKEKQKIASSQGTDYNVAVMISSLLEISKSLNQQFKSRPTDELVVLSQKIAKALNSYSV
jgi:hypothetical protein